MAVKICIALIVCLAASVTSSPWGGSSEHKHIKINVPYRVHTIHHHHVEKVPVYKKIEIPVVKEVKVPFPVHVPVKIPYPVVVKPHVVTVPVHHYPVHSQEHQHGSGHAYGGSSEGHEYQSSGSGHGW